MITIPDRFLVPLIGGTIVAFLTVSFTVYNAWNYGIHFDLHNNHKRQTLMNFLCLIAGLNGLLTYPFLATSITVIGTNITVVLNFFLIQYGLTMVNHNTMVRLQSIYPVISRTLLDMLCRVLYVMPLFSMIPIYFAAIDQVPKNGFIYASSWNRDVYKPLSLVLVFTTEVLATMTDFAVIYKVAYVASKNNQDRLERNLGKLTNGLVSHYLAIWTWVIVDAIIKLLIILGYPFLFDTMISIFSVALRAKCNMKYGLNLKDVLRPDQLSVKLQTVTKKMESSVVAIKSS